MNRPERTDHPDVILCPDGPMLLRGDHVVQDEDGQQHRTSRPVSAVCRCGGSMIPPWCDGTHKVLSQHCRR
ncbi:CDGSH iron-sulfur domain-containing protein [Ruania albidiflava]|uniref:CDGSH iron-sulfur domain-containing protein n=1 Tax=Ruania albidiflava TaxID=366586 RepID=UPI0023F1561C|nr:CDGSH iron-sulfur domain-containing protein [Ruania albidiflava]